MHDVVRRKESSRSLSHLLMSFFVHDVDAISNVLFYLFLFSLVHVRYMSSSVRLSVVCNVRAPYLRD